MQSLLPLISTVIAIVNPPVYLLVDGLPEQGARLEGQDLSGGDRYRRAGLRIPPLVVLNQHGFPGMPPDPISPPSDLTRRPLHQFQIIKS